MVLSIELSGDIWQFYTKRGNKKAQDVLSSCFRVRTQAKQLACYRAQKEKPSRVSFCARCRARSHIKLLRNFCATPTRRQALALLVLYTTSVFRVLHHCKTKRFHPCRMEPNVLCAVQDSNLRPDECKSTALPTELTAHVFYFQNTSSNHLFF